VYRQIEQVVAPDIQAIAASLPTGMSLLALGAGVGAMVYGPIGSLLGAAIGLAFGEARERAFPAQRGGHSDRR
jgi:hypothetical protein